MSIEITLAHLGATWHGWEKWKKQQTRLHEIGKECGEPPVVLDLPITHPINNKTQYYRALSRLAAAMIWKLDEPDILITDLCRKISLWLESTYGVRYDYKNSIYRWIRPLAPYEPPPTNKPRK